MRNDPDKRAAVPNGSDADETPAGGLKIVLNGEERAVAQGLSVAGLLAELGVEPAMVVVEHNRRILARDRLDATPLREADALEVVPSWGADRCRPQPRSTGIS